MSYAHWLYVHLLIAVPAAVAAGCLVFQWQPGWVAATGAVSLVGLAFLLHARRALRWMMAGAAIGLVVGALVWWLSPQWWSPPSFGWLVAGMAALCGLFVPLIWWERR